MPRLRLAAVSLLVFASLAASAPAAPARCAPDHPAFKVRGGVVCGKAGAASSSAALQGWVKLAARPLGRDRLPRRLRRSIPALARFAASAAAPPARARAAGPVVARQAIPVRTEVRNGVKFEASGELQAHSDGSTTTTLEVKATDRDTSLRFRPLMGFEDGQKVACPTADGSVAKTTTVVIGGTYIASKRGRVLESTTQRVTGVIAGRGRVGRDARLEHVDTTTTLTSELYRRGFQERWSVTTGFAASREGGARITQPMGAEYRIRVVGASAREELEFEREQVRKIAATTEIAGQLADSARLARDSLLKAEGTWYDLPNDCAEIDFSPADAKLAPGASVPVTGWVTAKNGGGQSSATFVVDSDVSPGSFTATRADADPGAPAQFVATGGGPDSFRNTVYAGATATSRAGRAHLSWRATYDEPEFPAAFVGSVTAKTDSPAIGRQEWIGNGTWTLKRAESFGDGSKTAWYELTEASLSQAESHLGEGCHYAAHGSGGRLQSGDLELRILPDGRRAYAFAYDVALDVTYRAEGCPSGSAAPPFAGTIAAMLNTRDPAAGDNRFRPAGEGWSLSATKATDVVQPPGGGTTIASWELTPAA
ncbi:MAG TPA: hypothetical protein VF529_19430 [Solirubrobacteraceae bacterium]|jgi:hypothetical protein